MRKITLFLAAIFCVGALSAQNLLTNPSFETWENNIPAGWSIFGTPKGYTVTPETTIVNEGSTSFKIQVASGEAGSTTSWLQIVPVTSGKTYVATLNYYVGAGDDTDVRIWCNFRNGDQYLNEADLIATGQFATLRGPGCQNQQDNRAETYLPGEASWKTHTFEVTIPANIDGFEFQFRTYKGATAYWDNFSFVEKGIGTNLINNTDNTPSFYVSGHQLVGENVANGTVVEIYSATGAKVQSSVINGNAIELNNLSKGVYIIKAGNHAQKIMF